MTDRTTEAILAERGAHYGDFAEIAEWVEQQMTHKLGVLQGNTTFTKLPRQEKGVIAHGLYMMTTKEARLLHGDVTLPDNFDDIAGYAKLVARMLHRRTKA